jgi:hypothetical protein
MTCNNLLKDFALWILSRYLNTFNQAYVYVTHVIPCSIQMITYSTYICICLLNRLSTAQTVNTSA